MRRPYRAYDLAIGSRQLVGAADPRMGRREECALAQGVSLGRRRRRHDAGTDDLLHLRPLGGRPPGCLGEQVLGRRSRHGCSGWDCNGRAKTWRVCARRVSVIDRASVHESWSSVHADQLSSAELVLGYGPLRRGGEPVGQVVEVRAGRLRGLILRAEVRGR
jgi:hypothetical protein